MITKNKFYSLALFCCVFMLTQACTSETYKVKPVRSACIESERDALLAVKAGLVDPRNRLSSWKGPDCCQWRGVACSKETTHVVRLDLCNSYNRYDIHGIAYVDMSYALGGEIRSPILSLHHLNYLDLSYNNFSGAKMPEFIGSLKELTYLNLSSAGFGGRILPQIGNLSNLRYLDLSNWSNYWKQTNSVMLNFGFGGKIPPQIGNLSNLQYLDLSCWINQIYSNEVTVGKCKLQVSDSNQNPKGSSKSQHAGRDLQHARVEKHSEAERLSGKEKHSGGAEHSGDGTRIARKLNESEGLGKHKDARTLDIKPEVTREGCSG